MHNINRALPLAIILLSLASCTSDKSSLRVTSGLPAGTVPSAKGTFIVTFSKAVVSPDSTNIWTDTPYIEFTPPIQGKYSWQDTARLVFSPDGLLPGDTRFRARLNTPLLTRLSGTTSFEGADEFTFSTESFALRKAEFFYDRIGEKRKVGIKANLEFTYVVIPSELQKYIRVFIDKEPVKTVRVMSADNSSIIPLEIGTLEQFDKEHEIEVTFTEGLISPETNTHIKIEQLFVFKLPKLEELKIYGHEFGFDGTNSWIRITTSQEVDLSTAKTFFTIDPVRELSMEGDGRSITLRGKLEPGSSFHIMLKKGLESVLGGKTQHDYEADIMIGNVKPSFRFSSESGTYLLLGGQKTIEVKTVNLTRLTVRVSQVFQNNLVFFLDQGRYYDYDYDYYDDGGGYRRKYRYYVGNYGRQLDYDTLEIAGVSNREVKTQFGLAKYLNTGYRGFYVVEIANPAEAWRATSKLVSVSDIGLIVKGSEREVLVFATSLETNSPVRNARVSLISTNNQVIANTTTDGDGVARFSNFREAKKDFNLKLVTAETDDDFNFINLADHRVETSRFDVAGKRDAQRVYDTYLYGDRNIYRPGETVFISGIVRDLTNDVPVQLPVRLKAFNPAGTLVAEQQHSLNEQGSFETNYQTTSTAQSGEYRFELYTGNNLYLSSYKVSVEDFVPDRLKVQLTASKESAKPGEKIKYELLALNFFGPPAAGRSWEFEGSFDILPYISKAFPSFRFSDDAARNYSANPDIFNGTTDDNGKATVEFSVPNNVTSTGLLRARARIAVFDESGRPVYQIAQTTIYPKDYYIGILNKGSYYVSPNTPQRVELVTLDQNDKPIDGFSVKIDIVRFEWHSVLRQHQGTGTLRYVSERREVPVRSDVITLGKKPVEYTYAVDRSGEYVVRVSKPDGMGYNQFGFYSYSWGTTDITSFEIDPEARVEMVFDKKTYTPGEKAKVLFQTPFSGTMLVTVERNGVLSYRYLNVVGNSASLEIPIEEQFLPNVYVSAVLFRKIKEQSIPLLAGHGFAPIMVEKKSNEITVLIESPEKIRPKTKQRITVHTVAEKDVLVTVAAVDEGICQVKNYKTPDPYAYFYERKALETETFDFFKALIPEPEKNGRASSSVGGGDDEAVAKRVNPLGVQRFKPLAIWSGILRTNSAGQVEVTLDVPEFSGQLRLMAVAYKGDRFGLAQKGMKVADPVVITPALPRFLSPDDSLTMPINAFNTTDKPVKLTFTVETSGGLVAMAKNAELQLEPNQERLVNVRMRSTNQIGKATVRVTTTAFGEKLESLTELPIRPVSPFVADGITGFVDEEKPVTHEIEDVYLTYGRRAFITLSPFPVVNFARQLKYLVGYPHGCLEQTVSKAFPQIYLRDVATLLDPSILNSGSPSYFVNEAITKVTAMQVHDGSFSYWPGGGHSNDWTTVYATHFLLEAKKAGYAVPEATLKAALNAIATISRSKRTQDYYYHHTQRVVVKRIADKSSVYGLYVLALGGVPEKSVMNFYRSEKSLLTTDTQFLLAGAFALSGDRRTFNELLPPQFITEDPRRTTGDNFDSPIRANALILNILLETDLNNAAIARYMDYLSGVYQRSYWYSTQDAAFTMLAFGKAARMASSTKASGTVRVGDKEHPYKGGNQKIDLNPFGKKVTITVQGDGRVYYSLVVEGIRTDGKVRAEDKNLQIRREFYNRAGEPANLASMRQNDLVVVKLTVNSSVDLLENVAISDLLPAGFEIENPRLTETTNYAFIKNASMPEYMDIRDDRINLYTSFRGGRRQQVFYYLVRAVTQGTFQYAPVVAEAMYNADYYSAHGATKATIFK